jgi:hypothetical protein
MRCSNFSLVFAIVLPGLHQQFHHVFQLVFDGGSPLNIVLMLSKVLKRFDVLIVGIEVEVEVEVVVEGVSVEEEADCCLVGEG